MLNFFCKILQHPKINPGSAPGHPIFFRKILIGNAIFQASQSLAFFSQSLNSQLSFDCHVETKKKRGKKIQTLFEHSNLKIRTKVRDNKQ